MERGDRRVEALGAKKGDVGRRVPSDQGRGDRLAAGRHDSDLAFVRERLIRRHDQAGPPDEPARTRTGRVNGDNALRGVSDDVGERIGKLFAKCWSGAESDMEASKI